MPTSDFHNELTDEPISLEQLIHINGAGLEKKYAKLNKPKVKNIKMHKPLTLKDIMNGGGVPGPYIPGSSYMHQHMLASNHQWL